MAKRQPPPEVSPALNDMIRLVAGFGGFLNRQGDGFPGPQTLWIRLQRTRDFVLALEAQRAMQNSSYGNDMSNRMPDSNTMALPPAAASISGTVACPGGVPPCPGGVPPCPGGGPFLAAPTLVADSARIAAPAINGIIRFIFTSLVNTLL